MTTYFRIVITENNGSLYTAIGDLKFYQIEDGIPILVAATGGTASASSQYSNTYSANKAFDGDNTTGWSTVINEMPCWIQYQFPTDQPINGFALYGAPSGFTNPTQQNPRSFSLKSSTNGMDWTDVLSVSAITWYAPYELRTFGFSFVSRAMTTRLRRNIEDFGAYRITGTVDELGVAGAYRVRLFDRISARCIRETWSDASGAYAFQNIAYRYRGYFVIAYDHGDNPHNAAIADLMTPEAMP